MKATSIIIATVLSLQVNVLFAGINETKSTTNHEAISFNINTLAPVTPVEATFEDAPETSTSTFNFPVLAPVTPKEADFSDVVQEPVIDLIKLAPVTPAEADFTNCIEDQSTDISALAPTAPAEADFE